MTNNTQLLISLITLIIHIHTVQGDRHSEAVLIAQLNKKGDLVMPEDALNAIEMVIPKGTELMIVSGWGFGDSLDLSLLLNTFSNIDEETMMGEDDKSISSGFYYYTTPQPSSIWAMDSGRKTKDGKHIILMACFFCDDLDEEISSKYFDVLLRVSHYVLFSTLKVTRNFAQNIAAKIKHAQWVDLLLSANSTEHPGHENLDEKNFLSLSPRVAWSYLGKDDEKRNNEITSMLLEEGVAMKEENIIIMGRPIPVANVDSFVKGKAPVVNQLNPSYREMVVSLFHKISEKAKKFAIKSGFFYSFLKKNLLDIQQNKIPAITSDITQLIQDTLEERKSDSIKLFSNILKSISKGETQWISLPDNNKKHKPINNKPVLFLDDVDTKNKFVVLVKNSIFSDNIETEIKEELVKMPASQGDFLTGVEKAWKISSNFFCGGYEEEELTSVSSGDTSVVSSKIIASELEKEKNHIKELHTSHIKSFVSTLSSLLISKFDTLYATAEFSDVCSLELESDLLNQIKSGVDKIFEKPKAFWPISSYQSVRDHEQKVIKAAESLHETRLKKAVDIIIESMTQAAEECLKIIREKCTITSDDVPVNSKTLENKCLAAQKEINENYNKKGASLSNAQCGKGDWIQKQVNFVSIKKKMESDAIGIVAEIVRKNDEKIEKKCVSFVEKEIETITAALASVEEDECPDEDKIDTTASHQLLSSSKSLQTFLQENGWESSSATSTCRQGLQPKVNDLVKSVKARVELRLFGSDEVRSWRSQWAKSVRSSVTDNCMLCKFHSYFIHEHLQNSAVETIPQMISGKKVSPGFRLGLAKKAVKKELHETKYVAQYETLSYGAAGTLVASLIFLKFASVY